MSKQKKTTVGKCPTTNKNHAHKSANKAALNALNAALLKVEKAHDALMKAMDREDPTEVERRTKKADAAHAEFEEIRRTLPEVKFDRQAGLYFLAHDADGRELYHVLCEVTYAKIIEVPATSETEAVKLAGEIADSGEVDLDDSPMKTRIVCQRG